MIHSVRERLADLLAASLVSVAGIYLLFWIFPEQIPPGLPDDLSSGHYPKAIMIGWIGSGVLWLLLTLFGRKVGGDKVEGGRPSLRSGAIMLLICLSYLLFVYVGFDAAATLAITGLAYVCGERGIWPWALGLIMPFVIFQFLDKVLDVTLPTILF